MDRDEVIERACSACDAEISFGENIDAENELIAGLTEAGFIKENDADDDEEYTWLNENENALATFMEKFIEENPVIDYSDHEDLIMDLVFECADADDYDTYFDADEFLDFLLENGWARSIPLSETSSIVQWGEEASGPPTVEDVSDAWEEFVEMKEEEEEEEEEEVDMEDEEELDEEEEHDRDV
ncbi:MAG: hypothetical protein LBR22_11435 [Desulfovibrio sp.]|jgi:hypothetical protein|nr:hypothetical protein [Desulfovibrio sp.]